MTVVAEDTTDKGRRAVLNLGHTVGHAIEASGGFQRWNHGQSVAMGLMVIVSVAEQRGKMSAEERRQTEELIGTLGLLPKTAPDPVQTGRYLTLDKKMVGNQLWAIIPGPIGQTEICPIGAEELLDERHWAWRQNLRRVR